MENSKKRFNLSVADISKIGILAAIYVLLTLATSAISFLPIQLRCSELLLFFVFFDKKYSVGILIGTMIANFLSPLGPIDALFGTFASAIVLALMIYIPNPKKILSLLWAPLINCLVVAFEFKFLKFIPENVQSTAPFYMIAIEVFCGEFIAIFAGYLIYLPLSKNEAITKFLTLGTIKKANNE